MEPVAEGSTMPRSSTVTLAPAGMSPSGCEPVQGCQVAPLLREYSGTRSCAGTASMSTASRAVSGPLLTFWMK